MSNAEVTAVPFPDAMFDQGTIVRVRWDAPSKKVPKDQVFFVTADKGRLVNVVKIGGDNGRYWRIPRAWLERLSVNDFLDIYRDASL